MYTAEHLTGCYCTYTQNANLHQKNVNIIFTLILTLCVSFAVFSQETYTARKGSRFFPGHWHAIIHVDRADIHYQLFNHWYSLSYAQYRDISIPLSQLEKYGEENDTLTIIVNHGKVKLIDKRNNLNRNIKHQKCCASVDHMRKISYANAIAEKHENLRHFDLFKHEDLKLNEVEFKSLVDKNVALILQKRRANQG